jgi:1-aminocyclopropane-1-carboxylate deaminase/D-cysteine desulfhydrase-like pyridoxal-dependent ACC family enzyme
MVIFRNFKKGITVASSRFGGAYSNHIIAVAAACNYLKIPCIGIIRGEIDIQNLALKLRF